MGSQYERQLIISLLHGKNEEVITKGSKALATKFLRARGRDTPILTVRAKGALPPDLGERLGELGGCCSRLYLFGHGSQTRQHVAGLTANQVFDALKDSWPEALQVTRVSLIACRLMGNQFQSDDTRITSYLRESFASKLFELLGPTRVRSLTARIHSMMVVDPADRLPGGQPLWSPNAVQGSKRTSPSQSKNVETLINSSVNHGEQTKVLFLWNGRTAKCKFYDYNRIKIGQHKLPDLPEDDVAGLENDHLDGLDFVDNPLL